MPALNVAFLVWCCSQLPLRNRRTTAVVCYWRPWERAVYSLAPSSKLNRRNKNSASSLTSATKCSLGVSALAEFRQWVSHVICEPPPEHVSGVRRCSVNKCLLHRYDDWSLGSQHLYFKKKKKSQVQLCTLVIPRLGSRDRRIPEQLPVISPEKQKKL